jgi:uncharacterized protein (DUF58 family)
MGFGTAERRKLDVAEGVALALGHLASRRGNRLGLVTFGADERTLPPRAGRPSMLGLVRALHEEAEAESKNGHAAGTLGIALDRAAKVAQQRAVVVIVSDFRGPRDWRQPLLRLAGRHDVIAVEIRDPREQELTNVGELWLVDPETGRRLRVDTGDRKLRDRFAEAAAAERKEIARELGSLGVGHVVLSTSGDWLRALAQYLSKHGARR